MNDRCRGCLLGLAVGDALGVTHEIFTDPKMDFDSVQVVVKKQRDIIETLPVTMRGGGPWSDQGLILEPGTWTDDTSMALCLADSLIDNGKYDTDHTMREYILWYDAGSNACHNGSIRPNGKLYGLPIGVGGTIKKALDYYKHKMIIPEHPYNAGNGCLMRIAPIALFFKDDMMAALQAARDQARATHPCTEAEECSMVMVYIMIMGIHGKSVRDILTVRHDDIFVPLSIRTILAKDAPWKTKDYTELISLPGRSIWSLECALWILYHSHSFKDAAERSVRLGGDCDTVSAITLQMCGAIYGENSIPKEWLDTLKHTDYIKDKTNRLLR